MGPGLAQAGKPRAVFSGDSQGAATTSSPEAFLSSVSAVRPGLCLKVPEYQAEIPKLHSV